MADKKILIAYFSYTQTTEGLAKEIHGRVGGDLVKIEPVEPYSTVFDELVARFRPEVHEKQTPAILPVDVDPQNYDLILIGTPLWSGTITPPMRTFLSDKDWNGKQIALFLTHKGSVLGKGVEAVQEVCSGASVGPCTAVFAGDPEKAEPALDEWIAALGL